VTCRIVRGEEGGEFVKPEEVGIAKSTERVERSPESLRCAERHGSCLDDTPWSRWIVVGPRAATPLPFVPLIGQTTFRALKIRASATSTTGRTQISTLVVPPTPTPTPSSTETQAPTPTPAPAAPPARSLDRSLLVGIAWTGGMKWAIQIVSWVSTVVIARLLSPSDYGLMGMAAVYLGLVSLVNEFGLTAAILRGRHLSDSQIAQIGGFGIAIGALFCLLSIAAANPIAHFYGEPAVRVIVTVLSLNFVFSSASVLPRSLLARDLDFRRLAWIDGLTNIVQILCTIVLAFLGYRYMALVMGSLVGRISGAVLANFARPHRVAVPRELRSISESVLVGWHVVVGRVSWYTYQNADFAIVGRVLGKVVLGAYTIGWEIATLPVERVSALVGQVTPGVFSSVQADRPALRRYYLGVIEGLAFITFPGAVGISLTAPLLVPVLLGDKWTAAILPLQLLAFYAGLRSIDTVTPQVLIYTGHSRQSMWYTVLAAIVLPMLFLAGTRWGAAGVAFVWIVAYPVVVSPIYRLVFRILDLSPRVYLRNLWPAASGTAVMAAAVLALRYTLPETLDVRVRLVTEVVAGAAIYAATMLTFHRARILAAIAPLRAARR